MSDASQGPGWWLASDGKWYPPQVPPAAFAPPVPPPQVPPQPAPPGYQWPYQPPAPPKKTNVLAVIALVCGILWGFGVLAVVALVLGLIALSQIRARNEGGRGVAIAGVVLGGVGILGAIASVIVLAAVGGTIRDLDRPATVTIQADGTTCWTAALSSLRSGDNRRVSGCGTAILSFGRGFGREATVTKTSGAGQVVAFTTVDGEETDRGSVTETFDSVSVEP